MQPTNQTSNPPGSGPAEQLGGVFAIAGAITLVVQHAPRSSGIVRYFNTHCMGGRKYMLPLGRGAGVPVLYCHEESETERIATRRKLVSNRDPHECSRERAAENIQLYCLLRKDRIALSLLTSEGQRALRSALDPATRVVVIDSLDGFTKNVERNTASASAPASLTELLEGLTARGIAVVIFTTAHSRKKEPPEWLDGLAYNIIHIEEDTRNPMRGGARLTIYRDAVDELDRAPRRYTWWWKVDDDGNLDCSCREEHFAEPVPPAPKAQDERREKIKALIVAGVTTQKELAKCVDCDPATVNRDIKKLIDQGEVLMHPTTKKLWLAGSAPSNNEDNSGDAAQGKVPE